MNFDGATPRISILTGGRLPPPTDLDGLAERFCFVLFPLAPDALRRTAFRIGAGRFCLRVFGRETVYLDKRFALNWRVISIKPFSSFPLHGARCYPGGHSDLS